MKSRLMRILAMILVIASLVSMFSIFTFAETAEDDTVVEGEGENAGTENDPLAEVLQRYPQFELNYQRSFDEGWDALNGFSFTDRGSDLYIDNETTVDYKKNYFMRFEVLSKENTYAQWNFDDKNQVGAVIEFDMKADDYCNIPGLVHFATPGGSSSERTNVNMMEIKDGVVYIVQAYEGGSKLSPILLEDGSYLKLSNDWTHFAFVLNFDYAPIEQEVDENGNLVYDNETGAPVYVKGEPYEKLFELIVYYGDTNEYKQTGELKKLADKIEIPAFGSRPKGLQFVRWGVSGAVNAADFGTSVCIDNLVGYTGANEYGLATPEMGNGSKCDLGYASSVPIERDDTSSKSSAEYVDEGVVMKVNVDYMRANKQRTPILEDENGDAYGAPIKVDGVVYVALEAVLNHIGFPYYMHEDGEFLDISTGTGASYISVGKKSATINGARAELISAPGVYDGVLYIGIKDIETILPGWYADYDDLGLIVISQHKDPIDRSFNPGAMMDLMKEFVFEYVTKEQIIEDVDNNTNGFDHPYLLGNQESFDRLNAVYNAKPGDESYDPQLQNWLKNGIVSDGAWAYERYAKWSHTYATVDKNWVVDENGEPVMSPVIVNGEQVMEPMLDEEGNIVYDENDEPIMIPAMTKTYYDKYIFYTEDNTLIRNLQIVTKTDEVLSLAGDKLYMVIADAEGNVDTDNKIPVTTAGELPEDLVLDAYDWEWRDYVGLMNDAELLDYYGTNYKNYSLEMPYQDSYGYDPEGGRSALSNRSTYVWYMAYSWQISRDIRYVLCAYDMVLRLGEWDHWGPGHFLNCADGSVLIAYFYDWCYDALVALGNGTADIDGDGVDDFDQSVVDFYGKPASHYDVDRVYDMLYDKAVYEGYIASLEIYTHWQSPIVGTGGSIYHHRENNWNAVCTSGMVIDALCLLDKANEENLDPKYVEILNNSSWLIEDNIYGLLTYGMMQYMPDGSYIEGPSYWSYGTNNFFELCMALDSAAGTNYGMMDCWGIDTTCLFACQTESSDYRTFNFHDGGMSSQDSSFFFYVADYFGDNGLADVRMNHLMGGKGISIYDLFQYPFEGTSAGEPMSLDYYSKNLDLYCARSSWEPGAVFVGMMGGKNLVTHGQCDGGSFVYHNAGKVWFIDLGTEEYNAAGFWPTATRYRYYVMKPEGNNTITLTSDPKVLPIGQNLNAYCPMVQTESNEHGSYAIFDMSEAFKGAALSWYRGMLLTNDRKTTVIQDEINFQTAQDIYWFGHYSLSYVTKVELSSDGRTAYMISGTNPETQKVLRVKLISAVTSLKFVIMGTGDEDIVHNDPESGTFKSDYAANNGLRVPEKNRSNYKKLAIHGSGVIGFNVAVVIEEIDAQTKGTPNEIEIGYEYDASQRDTMFDWVPSADMRGVEGGEGDKDEIIPTRGRQNPGIIRSNIARVERYFGDGTAFTTNIDSVYYSLTELEYVIGFFRTDPILDPFEDSVDKFDEFKAEYDEYVDTINGILADRVSIAEMLMGV